MRLIFALTLLACAACSARKRRRRPNPRRMWPARPRRGVAVTFMAPSGNIGCIYIPSGGTDVYQPSEPGAELQCDRAEPNYVRIVLPENGAARIVQTDERGCCSGETHRLRRSLGRRPPTPATITERRRHSCASASPWLHARRRCRKRAPTRTKSG